mgnify:CR=1 FL=1
MLLVPNIRTHFGFIMFTPYSTWEEVEANLRFLCRIDFVHVVRVAYNALHQSCWNMGIVFVWTRAHLRLSRSRISP